MRLVNLYKKTEILKYQIAEYNDPLGYMRVAMAAIRSGLPSSNYGNPIIFFDYIGILKDSKWIVRLPLPSPPVYHKKPASESES